MPWRQNHQEVRYRQGFEEGATALFLALKDVIPAHCRNHAAEWLEKEIEPWRQEAQRLAAKEETIPRAFPRPLAIRQPAEGAE